MDSVLGSLYDMDKQGMRVGIGASMPNVTRWLGDIRTYFPSSSVRVMQQDALERLNLRQMLTQPEMLEAIDPDVNFVATLFTLSRVIPERTKDTARKVVRKVVDDLMRKLQAHTTQAVRGSLNRSVRNYRPRHNEIDWNRTIRANLKTYQPDHKTIIPERLIGYGRNTLGAARHRALRRSKRLDGNLGGVRGHLRRGAGLDSGGQHAHGRLRYRRGGPHRRPARSGRSPVRHAAWRRQRHTARPAYCQQVITRPEQTIMVLITDCYEGSGSAEMLKRAEEIVARGVQVILLLALSDRGKPSYDEKQAAAMAKLGIPTFACTPDLFPDMMAAAIQRQDLNQWAARNDIVTARGE